MHVMLFSIGWRKTSRTWRRNSGNASRKSTPLWASDTSPGIGTWHPPIRPTSAIVRWRACHYGSSCQRGRKRVATTCSYGTGAVRRPRLWAKALRAATAGSAMAGS
jgi:hypothetical protein